MQEYPHHYLVSAAGSDGLIAVTSAGLPTIHSAPPAQFDGPGDHWSPESLLVASVADCFILTFRAVARASKLPWSQLACDADGVLERVDRVTRFTEFKLNARLEVPPGVDHDKARRLLDKAERGCLVTNSFNARITLDSTIVES